MNSHVACLTGLLLAATASAKPVTKLASEWFVPSSTSGKSLALVDESTGTVRSGFLSGDGELSWKNPIPTGITSVTSATGVIGLSGEILALTSPTANRVALVNIDAAAPYLQLMPSLSGVGPCGLAAAGPHATQELWVASASNGPNTGKLEVHDLRTLTPTLLAESFFSQVFRRLQPLAQPGGTSSLALYSETVGSNTRIGLAYRSAAEITQEFRSTLNGTVEFATQIRSSYSPAKTFAVGYRQGSSTARLLEFSNPLGVLSSITISTTTFPFAVSSILPILDGGVGPLTDGFLALSADGTQARWVKINAASTGFEATTQSFVQSAGQFLTGVLPMPGVGLVKLQGSTAAGPSSSFVAYQWNGSSWKETSNGTIPAIPSAVMAPPTLWFYDVNPAENEASRLLGVQNLGQWTRRSSYPDDLPSTVYSESFASSPAGLTTTIQSSVSPPVGATYAITNQVDAAASITSLGGFTHLSTPDLRIEPASGSYDRSFQVAALFDENRYSLQFRRLPDGAWLEWSENLPVAWSTNLEFYLRPLSGGTRGPIVSRSYTLSSSALTTLDSDHDGVPDYVEYGLGIDPFAGADTDGDGVSDLDEILLSNSPDNPTNPTNPALPDQVIASKNIGTGGMTFVAVARNYGASEIALTGEMFAHSLDGSLLASSKVEEFDNPLPDGGLRGAILRSASSPPIHELVALSSPAYFNVTTGLRSGREIIAFTAPTPPPTFSPAFVPVSTSSAATNTAGWVAAARTAAATHPYANSRTLINPADTAISVLLEQLVHGALATVRPATDPAPLLDAFSLFSGRELDRSRTLLSAADIALLKSSGFDFHRSLALAESARITALTSLANGMYLLHYQNSAAFPTMPLPLDVLRTVLRGGNFPSGYTPATLTPHLTDARAAYNAALANASQGFRPQEIWTVEIPAASTGEGIYSRMPGGSSIVLKRANGTRFLLEQGLGLRPGTRFSVTGFTDLSPEGTAPVMEITAVSLAYAPTSSDTDTDANLLDDEWERFFFGSIGQDPFSKPNGGEYSLLQYFLDGIDPRSTATPTSAVALSPQLPVFSRLPDASFSLSFAFPAAYRDRFTFILERSTTLAAASFIEVPDVTFTDLGADTYRVTIPPTATPVGNCFYRVRIRLNP